MKSGTVSCLPTAFDVFSCILPLPRHTNVQDPIPGVYIRAAQI
jgi:hypothetical protein